tara:strand:+ start:2798 stop:4357 length:1560 start_codon:yes stop_codon:yes gene_type:complete
MASMEGLNLELNQSLSSRHAPVLNRSTNFEQALQEAKALESNQSLEQMLSLTSIAKDQLPRLWVEIAKKKIEAIDTGKPVNKRLASLDQAMIYLRKAASADPDKYVKSKKWIKKAQEFTSIPRVETWHSREIDKVLHEAGESNKQKAYEWTLVILFKYARKHQFRSARLNYEIAMQYSRMSQMRQYASRKKEFLKEMNIFLGRSMGREDKSLTSYPMNNYYSRRSSLLKGVFLESKNNSESSSNRRLLTYDTSDAVTVDSSIVSALEANKDNRIEWGLKVLYEARKKIGKRSAKLSYFMAKQHFLFSQKSNSAEYRNKNRDSARKLLEEAINAKNKFTDSHPENNKWAIASKNRYQKEFPNPKPIVEKKPKSNKTGMILPTKGLVTSLYGMRKHPIYGTWKKHKGIDIAEYGNPPIKAMSNGVVTRASWFQGYGKGIEIRYDNGYTSFYAHLRDMKGSAGKTRVGMRVKKGQIVGHMGHTGIGSGDHLHLEIDYRGRLIDPTPVVSRIAGVAVRIGTEL